MELYLKNPAPTCVCVRVPRCTEVNDGSMRTRGRGARALQASVGRHQGSREGQERRGKGAPVGEGQERISGRASRQPLL